MPYKAQRQPLYIGSADRLAAASSPLLRERVPDEVFGVRHVLDAYAVAAGEQHHAPREPEGPWPTFSPARALCWLAAAEQQVVFDERRDHRLPARSAHHWQVRVRWWRLPPPNATSEWTGDERAHCRAPKSPYPVQYLPPPTRFPTKCRRARLVHGNLPDISRVQPHASSVP
jgi:hypothetical protein